MNVQWFPGHMTKALRMMEENVGIVDVFGYVLDARAPASSMNPSLEKLIGGKPYLVILNKCDLADPVKVAAWTEYFKNSGKICVNVSATNLGEANKIAAAFATLTKDLNAKYKQKGVYKPTRAMVMGVPNCGKSTIINCLSGKKQAVTGDKPGVTKGKQWVRLSSGIELLDTPGTVWPKFEDQQVAERLCFIGSIKDDVVDVEEISSALIDELREKYPTCLAERYKLSQIQALSAQEIKLQIAQKRGFVLRGGEIDSERCSRAVLDDFRKGKIGRITFEMPEVENNEYVGF